MQYDTIIIGAGLAGLSAASLLAKQGFSVAVMEHADKPGGTCGIFKRKDAIFDQGSSMLFGFGDHGFNAHRFLFNCLEEPFHVIRHDLLYIVHYNDWQIHFWPDVDRFIDELSQVFPSQKNNIRKFYKQMQKLYTHVISETPSYTTPDETNPREAFRSILKHPLSYLKFLSYLNISAEKLLRRYFDDPEILRFFDKLTSTYCYATVAEAPAILASVMFIDNHEGGSFYPAGSTLFLPGKLEKVIEENGGQMHYDSTVTEILFHHGKPCGIRTEKGSCLYGKDIIYSGTVWNLYEKLLPAEKISAEKRTWARSQVPTYSSIAFYGLVESGLIPPDTCAIEMLASSSGTIDESEITVYIPSMDDHTLCDPDCHIVIAIGPTFAHWDMENTSLYKRQKRWEQQRITSLLEKRFPGFTAGLIHSELATPSTIERFTMKNDGAAAGPKQMLSQHMLLRQHIRTQWDTLFCCGESTTMGTGTPTVTTSGIAAANAVLKKHGLQPYAWHPNQKNYVQVLSAPVEAEWLTEHYPPEDAEVMSLAGKCLYCSVPSCCPKDTLDIPGALRRASCGNFAGASKMLQQASEDVTEDFLSVCEMRCVQAAGDGTPVNLKNIIKRLSAKNEKNIKASVSP